MIKQINKWWMDLDPAEQYMYWIITFCMMLMSGIGAYVASIGFIVTSSFLPSILLMAVAAIACFITMFMMVVLFLTCVWPNHYEKSTTAKKPKSNHVI